MIATDADYLTAIKAMPPGAVQTFGDVSWDEYEALLVALDEQPRYRLAYDNGRLEIIIVSAEHECPTRLLPHLIAIIAEELEIDFLSLGSTTFRKKKKARGIDPDDCFYFKNYQKISGKKRLDLTVDPPPDLAVEVDVTHGSMSKFAIYASLGVPEFWRYRRGELKFYRLVGDDYDEIPHSDLFPFLTPEVVLSFLRKGEAEGTVAMMKGFRKWVRAHKP